MLRSSIMGIRDKARQNLLVGTINVALDRRLMTLDCDPIEDATFEFELVGLLVRAHLRGVGFDEIDVTIIVCPTELGRRFAGVVLFHGFQRFGAATAWGAVNAVASAVRATSMVATAGGIVMTAPRPARKALRFSTDTARKLSGVPGNR